MTREKCFILFVCALMAVGTSVDMAHAGPLLGSDPAGPGVSDIWDITPGGGPDGLLPASPVPVGALSGIVVIGPTLVGSLGHGGSGMITTHALPTGALLGSRPNGVGAFAIAGLDVAPPSAAPFGFIPGHVYGTAALVSGPTDTLIDLGLGGAGPDAVVAPLVDSTGAPILGIDGISFDPDTGTLHGGTGALAYGGAPHLVDLTSLATIGGAVVDLGVVAASGSVAGLQWVGGSTTGGTLYGSLGGGVGDLIVIPPAAPGTAFVDHTVAVGSLSGLALVPEPGTLALLGFGGLTLSVGAGRRRRSK